MSVSTEMDTGADEGPRSREWSEGTSGPHLEGDNDQVHDVSLDVQGRESGGTSEWYCD